MLLLLPSALLIAGTVVTQSPQSFVNQLPSRHGAFKSESRRRILLAALVSPAALLPSQTSASFLDMGATRRAARFEGEYDDRLHPLCERRVSVDTRELKVGAVSGEKYYPAQFTMTDAGPPGIGALVYLACDEDNVKQYGLREWSFTARVSEDGESVSASDGIHVGRWHVADENTPAENWQGIRWKDGNRWVIR